MESPKKLAARVMSEVEAVFGYPIKDKAVRATLLSTWEDDAEDDAYEEIFGFFIAQSVNWTAEAHAGPRPELAAGVASSARLEIAHEDDELEPEPPELLARHFCGLLTLDRTVLPRPSRHWLADLNVSLAGDAPAPIYLWRDGPFPEGAVFDSAPDRESFTKLLRALKKAEAAEDDAAQRQVAKELREKHPRGFAVEYPLLVKNRLLPAALQKPVPDAQFTDQAGSRLWAAVRAFVPVGGVLLARAAGQRGAKLTAADAKTLAAVAAGAGAESWPPALLAGLLGPALGGGRSGGTSGDDEARQIAQAILKKKSGVPLTQRWAHLVAEREGPFAA